MRSKLVTKTVLASFAIGFLFGSTPSIAEVECHHVKGKILNSSHIPALGNYGGMGGVSTVGVVALNGGNTYGKMKCALVGVQAGEGETPPGSPFGPLPDFTHTISCDDSVDVVGVGTVHSQLTFDTSGYFTGFDGVSNLYFTETSIPRDGSGVGAFAGTSSGSLTIEGTLNFLTGSIDMKLDGDICNDVE